ncbi:hypothetical protein GNI_062040 [Gregarina niphandrodes]|uniref:Uncharacterized protein n=1 Tax=Gregarina niphandrodes TaxID=110365 RepID=A0A023B878_GRENI|nr:hypothetical protein GNI_062040 [Gregarina niphandrodes]EZG68560.1 hypothetical protein GNI_062040 [Gregarina niphandrodes]|eukprot:XP_011134567.1 hypothetical protein GNI_062040 [Gregarina niphandrodes]
MKTIQSGRNNDGCGHLAVLGLSSPIAPSGAALNEIEAKADSLEMEYKYQRGQDSGKFTAASEKRQLTDNVEPTDPDYDVACRYVKKDGASEYSMAVENDHAAKYQSEYRDKNKYSQYSYFVQSSVPLETLRKANQTGSQTTSAEAEAETLTTTPEIQTPAPETGSMKPSVANGCAKCGSGCVSKEEASREEVSKGEVSKEAAREWSGKEWSASSWSTHDWSWSASEETEQKTSSRCAVETKSAETKSAETKFAETKSAEVKSAEVKFAETKSAEAKSAQFKSAETRSAEAKSAQFKSAEVKSLETSPINDKAVAEEVPTAFFKLNISDPKGYRRVMEQIETSLVQMFVGEAAKH